MTTSATDEGVLLKRGKACLLGILACLAFPAPPKKAPVFRGSNVFHPTRKCHCSFFSVIPNMAAQKRK